MSQRVVLFYTGLLLCNAVIAGRPFDYDDGSSAQQVLQIQSSESDTSSPHALSQPAPPRDRRLHGRFLHITDIHPDAFYQVHSSTDEAAACHRGKGLAGYYGAETSDCDTPFSLVNATFDWLDTYWKDKIDFIVWTGDSARHDSDDDIPRNSKQVLGTNRWIAQKFADLLYNETSKAMNVPVVPTFGNNDILPHNIMLPGPNRWLQDYSSIWYNFIPEDQRHIFEHGGYFSVEVIPNKLAVFSLNTLYFFDRNAAIDDCIDPSEPGFKQLEWLRIQLRFMRQRGMKAIIIGHVPPARTPSKMLWDESCWQKYTLWMQQYRDVITAGIYGHMNIDHFMLQDSDDVDMHKLDTAQEFTTTRESLNDELTVQGATDYLMEMRRRWSELPKSAGKVAGPPFQSDEEPGTSKKPKLGGPWGERFSATMVGGSIVPNFFPSFRVYNYNITGLENAAVWVGGEKKDMVMPPAFADNTNTEVLSQALHLDEKASYRHAMIEIEKKKAKKGKKGGKSKPKPKDPNLVVPEPPSETAPPGPAYSPQTLTIIGYEQWFCNLTRINNETVEDESGFDTERWRKGKHRGKRPTQEPQPGEFTFELEYNTTTDKILKLRDLTVPSFIKLAYRMAKTQQNGKSFEVDGMDDSVASNNVTLEDDGSDFYEVAEEEAESDSETPDEFRGEAKKKKKGKKNKNHKHKHNKVWLRFLKHAFVSTVDKKDLEKLDY